MGTNYYIINKQFTKELQELEEKYPIHKDKFDEYEFRHHIAKSYARRSTLLQKTKHYSSMKEIYYFLISNPNHIIIDEYMRECTWVEFKEIAKAKGENNTYSDTYKDSEGYEFCINYFS